MSNDLTQRRKLKLNREVMRVLSTAEANSVGGGTARTVKYTLLCPTLTCIAGCGDITKTCTDGCDSVICSPNTQYTVDCDPNSDSCGGGDTYDNCD